MVDTTFSPASVPASIVACVSRIPKYAGTVITTLLSSLPNACCTSSNRCRRISAEMLSGVWSMPCMVNVRASPMLRFTMETTNSGSAMAALRATSPTATSVGSWKYTTEGVVGCPVTVFGTTTGCPFPSR